MLLLLAEDDPKISELLIHLLKKDGYQVDYAPDGEEALIYCENNKYDVVILDWMMPEESGLSVCRELREKGYQGGILMLTAKDTIEDKIIGLEAGADDYIVKPFEYRELLARVKALQRRSERTLVTNSLHVGHFMLERETNSVYRDGVPVNLSKREFQLFCILLENSGKVVPRDTLIDRVWGIDGDITQNNLDSFIRLLRKKIEKRGEKKVIISVRGIGYRIEV